MLLSATPPAALQKELRQGHLPYVRVPVRYHGHPLPVPMRIPSPPIEQWVRRGRVPHKLRKSLQLSLDRGAQLFVFVPKIALVEPLVRLLSRLYPDKLVKGTSSKDEERGDKVSSFREKTVDLLVTTTILERGVTVPKTDVFILGADSRLFDEASLVQMSGRAGRSKDDPNGHVYFVSQEWTRAQASAVRQIRTMNRIASDQGYLQRRERKTWNHPFFFWRI
ncbi:helicase-related protein [Gorillibacterium sp. sgz5001074]|uniref:helicase-related protein n=1 Tax=Gorillibacterium sp. sgz5001074 TaxID=3446695 RepID=UPI003F67824C